MRGCGLQLCSAPQDNDTWALYEVKLNVTFYNNGSYVYLETNQSSKPLCAKGRG